MKGLMRTLQERVLSAGASPDVGGKNLVAFSGGVDSSLVAALVYKAYPRNSVACVGVSAALPSAQLQLARSVASHIGIPLTEVSTGEGSDPSYIANEGQSCFHCKTHLYSSLEAIAERAGAESRSDNCDAVAVGSRPGGSSCGIVRRRVVLFNGTNKDDKRDPTRVGLKAAADFQVASPIDMLTKAEVRAVSRELGLPNWNHAASPCLRSRLAFGVQATPERLQLVEQAEEAARTRLGLGVSHNLRVRAMHGNKALLELFSDVGRVLLNSTGSWKGPLLAPLFPDTVSLSWFMDVLAPFDAENEVDEGEMLEEASRALPDIRRLILPLGFAEVDVRAFRSGAVSAIGVGRVAVAAAAGGVEITRVVGNGQMPL